MMKLAATLVCFSAILGSNDAQAQKVRTLEQELDGAKYLCEEVAMTETPAQFELSFKRHRRHKHGYMMLAYFNGNVGSPVDSSGVAAQIDFIDPANKKFEMDISDILPIHLFHKGRVRNLKTRARFDFSDTICQSIEGELTYVVGRKRDGNRRREQMKYACCKDTESAQ